MGHLTFLQAQDAVLTHYGVRAHRRSITSSGKAAQVLVTGDGPPAFMLSGAGTPAAMFAPLMGELDGHTLYAVDWPGHGQSDADPTFGANLRHDTSRFILDALDQLGLDRPPVIANSFGSWASTWFASAHPDRISAFVHLGCPAIALDTSAPLPMRLLSSPFPGRLMMKIQPPSPRQVRSLAKMVGEFPLEPHIAEVLLATERQPHFDASFVAIINALVRLRGSRPEQRLTARHLGGITQPTLLVFGTRDPFGAADVGERLAVTLPNAQLHTFDAGHSPWLRHPAAIGTLVKEFLATSAAD